MCARWGLVDVHKEAAPEAAAGDTGMHSRITASRLLSSSPLKTMRDVQWAATELMCLSLHLLNLKRFSVSWFVAGGPDEALGTFGG